MSDKKTTWQLLEEGRINGLEILRAKGINFSTFKSQAKALGWKEHDEDGWVETYNDFAGWADIWKDEYVNTMHYIQYRNMLREKPTA